MDDHFYALFAESITMELRKTGESPDILMF